MDEQYKSILYLNKLGKKRPQIQPFLYVFMTLKRNILVVL